MPIERDLIDGIKEVDEAKEEEKTTMSVFFNLFRKDRELIDECAKKEFLPTKLFVRKVILDYCKLRKGIWDKEQEVEEKFIQDYTALKREYLEKLHSFKKRREEMLQMTPQDDEGDDEAFSEEELME